MFLQGPCYGCLIHFAYNANDVSLFVVELEKLLVNGKIKSCVKQICFPGIVSNVANVKNKLSKTVMLQPVAKMLRDTHEKMTFLALLVTGL